MKNRIIYWIIVLFVLSTGIMAQTKSKIEDLYPKKLAQTSDELQIEKAIESVLHYYGKLFRFYSEFRTKNFSLERMGDKDYSLLITNRGKKRNETISIKMKKVKNPNGNYELGFIKGEIEQFINFQDMPSSPSIHGVDSIIERNNILWDKMILANEKLEQAEWRIFNRGFLINHEIENQNGDQAQLFKFLMAGMILPYDMGTRSKVVAVDNEFHSILYFDSEMMGCEECTNGCFGHVGIGYGEFLYPSGITVGQAYTEGEWFIYPMYIADKGNFRVIKLNYKINTLNPKTSTMDGFSVLHDTINSPFDAAYYAHEFVDEGNSVETFYDKLWVGQSCPWIPQITNMDPTWGTVLQRVIGYKDAQTGQTFVFEPPNNIRLKIYRAAGISLLSFIDSKRNCIVTCQLDLVGNGTVSHYPVYPYDDGCVILASDIISFPEDIRINGLSFQSTGMANESLPYLWVTSGYQPPYNSESLVHCLKMDENGRTQYLASTRIPRNSEANFSDLYNISIANNYFDILTIEKWNDNYGVRQYWPFADVGIDTLEVVCTDAANILRWNAVFTNECYVQIKVDRLTTENTWDSVKIKTLNGIVKNSFEVTKFQMGGWNQNSTENYIDLELDLPPEDYMLGGILRLRAKLYPEYEDSVEESVDYTSIERQVNVIRGCEVRPIGCPFLYVTDENQETIVDNNILHRSEFTPSVDILDLYKLRITPSLNGDILQTYLVETENNISYVDRVKLYAVDYPANVKLGITEDNQFVTYDSVAVIPADSVMLGNQEITTNVHYHNPTTPVLEDVGDTLSAYFLYLDKIKNNDKKTNIKKAVNQKTTTQKGNETRARKQGPLPTELRIAFISEMWGINNPIGEKDTAGDLTALSLAPTSFSGSFARRQLRSNIILPLFETEEEAVDTLGIKFQSDVTMRNLGITHLTYGNYVARKVDLAEGKLITVASQSDITTTLETQDETYGQVDSSKVIRLRFDTSQLPKIGDGDQRSYVIEIIGHTENGESRIVTRGIGQEVPLVFSLSQNYPNPFNPTTKINYSLPKNSKVILTIYDILGREVIRLVNNEFKEAGRYTVEFDGKNFASGVYFYRIEAGSFVQSKKMVLIK